MFSTDVSLIVAFSAGLLSFLSPCVLPLIPSYLSFITGIAFDEFKDIPSKHDMRRRVLFNSLLFIGGFSAVFIALGASFSLLGRLLFSYQELIMKLGGILVIFLGVYITGALKIPLLARYLQFELRNKPAGYIGSALVGISFAAGWTPCIGPILGAILTMAATKPNTGVILLTAYSMGLGVPFLLSSLAIHSFFNFFDRFRRYIHIVHVGGGVLLIIIGVLMFINYFTVLNSYALRLTPIWLLERL
ncbi:MAG: cytochrome c biogenesis protein CcdA [Candidatus Tectomicrobia bacterium]|nr:cytochrome c biogenesis protein CcdA [Candidatus Tectomicrobia bacterium]